MTHPSGGSFYLRRIATVKFNISFVFNIDAISASGAPNNPGFFAPFGAYPRSRGSAMACLRSPPTPLQTAEWAT
jgi:hypothetical protein